MLHGKFAKAETRHESHGQHTHMIGDYAFGLVHRMIQAGPQQKAVRLGKGVFLKLLYA